MSETETVESLKQKNKNLESQLKDLESVLEKYRMVDDMSFDMLEMAMRDGKIDLQVGSDTDDSFSRATKILAASALHMLLGEENEMPPNYRVVELHPQPKLNKNSEFVPSPRIFVEVVKMGGKSSHEIRQKLEQKLAE